MSYSTIEGLIRQTIKQPISMDNKDKSQYKEVIERSRAKHAWAGNLLQTHLYPGDPGRDYYRVTELQDKPGRVRVISTFFEQNTDFEPREHYIHPEMVCTIYVER